MTSVFNRERRRNARKLIDTSALTTNLLELNESCESGEWSGDMLRSAAELLYYF